MKKSVTRKTAWILSFVILVSLLFESNILAADNKNEEILIAEENVTVEQEAEVSEKVETQDTSEDTGTSQQDEATCDTTSMERGLINYVGIDLPYLETPADQNIVISYGDGSEDVTDARLVTQADDGTSIEMQLSKKEGELFLFTCNFDETGSGVYTVTDFIYTQDGAEQTIHLADIGIESMFGVNEEYPGYGETYAEDTLEGVTEQEVELSVVDVETGDVQEATTDIEEAIQTTEAQVSAAKASRAGRAADQKEGDLVVVLDPGHGGSDSGAVANGLVEKDLNLKIAQYCKEELEQYNGVTVYMTRSDDRYLGIAERVDLAEDPYHADVLVSIHINSATPAANGAEVYYPNENYNPSVHEPGKNLAQQIQNQLVSLGLTDRDIKVHNTINDTYPDGSKQDYYGIIRYSKLAGFPGIIVEHAFISNPGDAAKLAQESFLKQLGIADATGIANAYGLSKGSSIRIDSKNDFEGNAQIKVAGIGSNGTVKVWNKETGALREYTLTSGKQTIEFNIADYNGARGTYCIEAFNSAGQKLLSEEFYVSKDTSSTVTIDSGGTETNYTVDVKFSDMPAEIVAVEVPVWTKADQSDIRWLNATQTSSGNWRTVINIKDYKTAGTYNVHVYATLKDGSQRGLAATTMEVSQPAMNGRVENYDAESGTFEVIIDEIYSPSGVEIVQIPVWCADDQSDLIWYTAEKQDDGSYKSEVNVANHGYAVGNYKINAYLTTGNGIQIGKDCGIQKVGTVETKITAESIGNKELQYQLKVNNVELLGSVQSVLFATWSENGGQDDLVWYSGHKNAGGTWEATVDIRDHKTAGKYEVDVYYVLANGTMKGLGSTFFEVSQPDFTVEIENYNAQKGTFEVVVSNIAAPSEVAQVQVPVWCASDQSDIRWYDAEKQSDDTYKAKVGIANHKFATGVYQVHVYLTTGNGLTRGVVAGTQEVTLPDTQILAEDMTGEEMTYKLEATNLGLLGVLKSVMFATWSEAGGQDDLVWYTGHKNADGNWETTVDIRDHKTAGKYEVDVYYTLVDGTMKGLGSASFNVQGAVLPSEIVIKDYDETTGRFLVVIPEPQSAAGVSDVLVPVWCSEDQSDIRWYNTQKQKDGSYVATIDPMYHNYNSGLYKIDVYVDSNNGIQQYTGSTSQMVSTTQLYTIMGDTSVTIDQMVKYYETSGHTYPSVALGVGGAPTLEEFCLIYLEEAKAEGVRAEVAFSQAMKETGWLRYGGIVRIEQFNFAGIGALDGNENGQCASFKDVRTGIRAQIQHLKAYGSENDLINEIVDPRFHLVKRNSAPYVEWLGTNENPEGHGWATEKNYGYDLVLMIRKLRSI